MGILNHWKRLRKQNKKGSLAIEIVIGMFIFLLALSFTVDLLTIGWKMSVVSQTNGFLARTVGIQGGLESYAPTGFPGGGTAYIDTSQMEADIARDFQGAGIQNYSVTVDGMPLGSNVQVDYGGVISTRIVVDYRWTVLSNFIPGLGTHQITSNRTVLSEFKYRYDGFQGE